MAEPTMAGLLDEYYRYRTSSPMLSERARLILAERILTQMQECES